MSAFLKSMMETQKINKFSYIKNFNSYLMKELQIKLKYQ